MCMVVYVASDYPLPTRTWDQANPQFHVTELAQLNDAVQRHFSKPCVYYTGSHEGCGCGFQYGEYESFEDEAELAANRESRRRLVEFLSVALQHQASVEVYACWSGDEGEPADHTGHVRPMDLLRERTYFREREFMILSDS